jgi:hypothetical protein
VANKTDQRCADVLKDGVACIDAILAAVPRHVPCWASEPDDRAAH